LHTESLPVRQAGLIGVLVGSWLDARALKHAAYRLLHRIGADG
jgi:hypothetical protein